MFIYCSVHISCVVMDLQQPMEIQSIVVLSAFVLLSVQKCQSQKWHCSNRFHFAMFFSIWWSIHGACGANFVSNTHLYTAKDVCIFK